MTRVWKQQQIKLVVPVFDTACCRYYFSATLPRYSFVVACDCILLLLISTDNLDLYVVRTNIQKTWCRMLFSEDCTYLPFISYSTGKILLQGRRLLLPPSLLPFAEDYRCKLGMYITFLSIFEKKKKKSYIVT
jgi:hypothetical protein